jgi:hypothetical protein
MIGVIKGEEYMGVCDYPTNYARSLCGEVFLCNSYGEPDPFKEGAKRPPFTCLKCLIKKAELEEGKP